MRRVIVAAALALVAGCSGTYVTGEVIDVLERDHAFDVTATTYDLPPDRCLELLVEREARDAILLCGLGRKEWCEP